MFGGLWFFEVFLWVLCGFSVVYGFCLFCLFFCFFVSLNLIWYHFLGCVAFWGGLFLGNVDFLGGFGSSWCFCSLVQWGLGKTVILESEESLQKDLKRKQHGAIFCTCTLSLGQSFAWISCLNHNVNDAGKSQEGIEIVPIGLAARLPRRTSEPLTAGKDA